MEKPQRPSTNVTPSGAPVVFLDFDGVTHPEVCKREEHFTCLPLIEDVLRQHPSVDVVISSSWRFSHPLEQLRKRFSRDIVPRVIDCTPISPRGGRAPAVAHQRELDIRLWLQANAPTRSWIAIDDVPWLFSAGCPNLFLTNHRTGFTLSNALRLHERLSR